MLTEPPKPQISLLAILTHPALSQQTKCTLLTDPSHKDQKKKLILGNYENMGNNHFLFIPSLEVIQATICRCSK